jgi:hypothetical protein
MSKFGKTLFGLAVFTVAAAGVYGYLKSSSKESVCDSDADTGDKSAADENSKGFTDPDVDSGADDDYVSDAAAFAERAYTTLKETATSAADKVRTEVAPKVKETIGPKGEDILKVVGDTAVQFKDAVVESAGKVRDIVNDKEKTYTTVDSNAEEKSDNVEEFFDDSKS